LVIKKGANEKKYDKKQKQKAKRRVNKENQDSLREGSEMERRKRDQKEEIKAEI
ncbi:8569_t:CDS:2, partial [Gigaspora margarita]